MSVCVCRQKLSARGGKKGSHWTESRGRKKGRFFAHLSLLLFLSSLYHSFFPPTSIEEREQAKERERDRQAERDVGGSHFNITVTAELG